MRNCQIIVVFLLFLQCACSNGTAGKNDLIEKELDKNYRWTSNSIFMGDTNICVKLPNVVNMSTDEVRCFADPFSTNITYTSLMDTDTVKISTEYVHVDSKFFRNYDVNKLDSTQIENEILRLKTENPKTEFYEKSFHRIDHMNYYILKYKQSDVVFYSIKFFGKKGILRICIANLKDKELADALLQSLKLEKPKEHICF